MNLINQNVVDKFNRYDHLNVFLHMLHIMVINNHYLINMYFTYFYKNFIYIILDDNDN